MRFESSQVRNSERQIDHLNDQEIARVSFIRLSPFATRSRFSAISPRTRLADLASHHR